MKEQHTLIKGYRDLSQQEINLMNEVKSKAEEVKLLVNKVSKFSVLVDNIDQLPEVNIDAEVRHTDKRWISIANTDFQTGFMALVISIAQPGTY